jgi:hypothetical protein
MAELLPFLTTGLFWVLRTRKLGEMEAKGGGLRLAFAIEFAIAVMPIHNECRNAINNLEALKHLRCCNWLATCIPQIFIAL